MSKPAKPEEDQVIEIPDTMPLLPVRDFVIFPHMVLPLFVGREMSIRAIEEALAGKRMIFLATQKQQEVENPQPADIHAVGTVGMIMRMLKLPDGRIKILVQGVSKGRILDYTQETPFYTVKIQKITEAQPTPMTPELEALIRAGRSRSRWSGSSASGGLCYRTCWS